MFMLRANHRIQITRKVPVTMVESYIKQQLIPNIICVRFLRNHVSLMKPETLWTIGKRLAKYVRRYCVNIR
jgi:hypothetical protein